MAPGARWPRGLACPAPVLQTKATLQEEKPDSVSVVVDNAAAQQNVQRFLESQRPSSDMYPVRQYVQARGDKAKEFVDKYEAVLKQKMKADYHAVPHAVFMYPEIASVGLGEREAIEKFGEGKVLIGFYR